MSFQTGVWYLDSDANQYYRFVREGAFYVPVYRDGSLGQRVPVHFFSDQQVGGAYQGNAEPDPDSRDPRILPSSAITPGQQGSGSSLGYEQYAPFEYYERTVTEPTENQQHDRYNVTDENGTSTVMISGPAAQITDPDLFNQNISARRYIGQTPGRSERLDPSFQIREHPRRFFRVGKVFSVLWSQPVGNIGQTNWTEVTVNQLGEYVHSKVRRFIVVREGQAHCSAVAISTYSGQGVAKRGVNASEHAIVYTGRHSRPRPMVGEGEMLSNPIRVDPDYQHWSLNAASRIDFGKVYTIEHNIKVKPFGMVLNLDDLHSQFFQVWRQSWSRGAAGPSNAE